MRIALGLQHSWQLRYRARLAGVRLPNRIRRNEHLQRRFTQQEKEWIALNYKRVSINFIRQFMGMSWRVLYRNLHANGYSKQKTLQTAERTYQPTNNQQQNENRNKIQSKSNSLLA